MNPEIGLAPKNRAAVVQILRTLLADETVLSLKTRDAHWNVAGPHFNHLHAFFEELYDALAGSIDELAERIRVLGGHASMAEYLRLARLAESPATERTAEGHVAALLADHEAMARHLRDDIALAGGRHGDVGTEDFLTGLLRDHEETAWKLRASSAA